MNLENLEIENLENSALGIDKIFPGEASDRQLQLDSINEGVGSSISLFKVRDICLNYELNSNLVELNNSLTIISSEHNLLETVVGGIKGKDPFAIEGNVVGGIGEKEFLFLGGIKDDRVDNKFSQESQYLFKEYLNNIVDESQQKTIEILNKFSQKSKLKENLETVFVNQENFAEIRKTLDKLASDRE